MLHVFLDRYSLVGWFAGVSLFMELKWLTAGKTIMDQRRSGIDPLHVDN